MRPFIAVYHFVLFLFQIPMKVLGYAYTGILYIVDHITRKKEKKQEVTKDEMEALKELNLLEKKNKGKETKNEEKAISFRYVAKNSSGQVVKSTFEANAKQEVEMFLRNEGYEIISIEPRKPYDIDLFVNHRLKTSELSFMLTQLSTYIKAGIPLIDSVRILAKQSTNPAKRKIYEKIIYELLIGENLSTALEKQGKIFPRLLINMIKTAEMTGDLATILDDMSEYYTSMEKTKKQMISAMTYPLVIFIIAIFVVAFILMFVVPQFVSMFEDQNASLPGVTLFVIKVSNFLKERYFFVLLGLILLLLIYRGLYENIKGFRKTMQTIYMKLPVMGTIIIYNEVANFTKTFASLLNHSVFITDSMEILSQVTNNEVYKEIINKTLINLSKGSKISETFKGHWAFPVVAYEMLVTGENTGQLGLMMEKVAEHYQNLHKTKVSQIKSLIEPIMIGVLAVMVGTIILSIVIPMFSIYDTIS